MRLNSVDRAIVEDDPNGVGFEYGEQYFSFRIDVYTGALTRDYGEPPAGTTENGQPDGLVFNPGRAPETAADYSPLGQWMLELHANLFLGQTGTFIVGTLGVLYLLSTVTGLFIYGPFMKALAFGAIRRRSLRFALADAHKLVGIASLMFNAMIALTGIGITLGFFAIQFYLLHELRGFEQAFGEIKVSDPPPAFEKLLAAGNAVVPEEHVYHIRYPGGIQGDQTCIVFARPDAWKEPLVPTYVIATVEAEPRPMHAVTPFWVQAILIGAPIHYGDYGGRAVRVVYLLLAMTSGALSVTGYVIWFAKARAKRRKPAAAQGGQNLELQPAEE